VSLSVSISLGKHVQCSLNFLCMLPMVLAPSSSGGILALQYVVHFSFMDNVISAHNGQEQRKK